MRAHLVVPLPDASSEAAENCNTAPLPVVGAVLGDPACNPAYGFADPR